MISISKEANNNYLCKIFKIKSLEKHSNADKLQICNVDFQPVITGLDAKIGDVYVYFPVESKINKEFLSFTNSFRESELNFDKTKKGFFEKNCRVRAVKLRNENSCGYIVPIKELIDFTGEQNLDKHINEYFDTINDIKIVEKYVVKQNENKTSFGKSGKTSKVSKIVENQFHFSVDVDNFRRNVDKIKPDMKISTSKKLHGTNFVASHVLVKRDLNFIENVIENKLKNNKFLSKYLPIIKTEEYGYVFSSRRVVKSVESEEVENKDHFYDFDLWTYVGETYIKGKLPKGYSIYGEIVGYVPNTTSFIQKGYDYGCNEGECKVFVFRVTYTNPEGKVFNLNLNDSKEFCERVGLNFVEIYYYGKAKDMFPEITTETHWNENFLEALEKKFLEVDDNTCKNKVPFEGIVIRNEENPFNDLEIFKLKSFSFLNYETKMLDSNEENIEDEN